MDLASSSSALLNNTSPSLIQPIMHVLSTAVLIGSVAVQTVLGFRGTNRAVLSTQAVDDFIDSEGPIALQNLLCNVGSNGCRSHGAAPGIVIASPSTNNPDYLYTWTRDAGLVFKSIVDRFTNYYDASLQQNIEQYIASQAKLQSVSNPSGGLSDGAGLAEPKFMVDGTPFTGAWGRPQRDGPALRAIAMIGYAKWLIANGYSSTVKSAIWPVVRNDLNYVAQYWNQTGFDLWEEVQGSSFFTIANQHRALVEGATLAASIGQSGSNYASIAPQILCFQQRFWVSSGGYIQSNINTNNGRTGKDANSILTSIHTFDHSLGCDVSTFQPCSDRALSNHKAVVDTFRYYGVNSGIPVGQGIAIGRYSEDVYYSGNPWYLATLAAAEQLYDAVYTWEQMGTISVTSVSLNFFKDLIPSIQIGQYPQSSATFSTIINAVKTYADSFVGVVAKYTPADGSMTEQFEKSSGTPTSATHLTWSYAAFLTAAYRRAGVVPPGWANGNATVVPTTCSGTTVSGSYSSAGSVVFPAGETPTDGVPTPTFTPAPQPTTSPCGDASSVAVVFQEQVVTQVGQNIKIVGNVAALGNWNPSNAVALSADKYTSSNPLWYATVNLPAGQTVEYKYIKIGSDGSVTWESDPNRSYTVPTSCSNSGVENDTWR